MSRLRLLILCPYPPFEAPSQRFRFEMHMGYLRRGGYHITQAPFWNLRAWRSLYKKGAPLRQLFFLCLGLMRRLLWLWKARHYDLVFVHREATPILFPFLEWWIARALKKPLLYDFDDAIWLTDPSVSPLKRLLKYPTKTRYLCRLARRVLAGNAFLAEYAMRYNKAVSILPTIVDTQHAHNPSLYRRKKIQRPFTIGWTGTHSTLPYLDELWSVLQALSKEMAFRFLVIANVSPPHTYPWLCYRPWRKETEMEDLLELDVGVMPLPNDTWSAGKCGFKIIQYLALCIPALASAVGVNSTMIRSGYNGYLCRRKEEWRIAIRRLYKDKALRQKMGQRGRQHIQAHFSAHNQHAPFLNWLNGEKKRPF